MLKTCGMGQVYFWPLLILSKGQPLDPILTPRLKAEGVRRARLPYFGGNIWFLHQTWLLMRFFLTVFSLQPIHLISYEYIINSVFVVHGMHPTWLYLLCNDLSIILFLSTSLIFDPISEILTYNSPRLLGSFWSPSSSKIVQALLILYLSILQHQLTHCSQNHH